MIGQVLDLITKLTSSDNNLRIQAELDFKALVTSEPSQFLYTLISIASNVEIELSTRQASLLHLKRFTPNYWTPAFDSFVGPSTIDQQIKQLIRDSLIKLIADPDSKIRNGASYAIVQIAAVDYPDEWPNLLNDLYELTTSETSNNYQILGSLSVLQELFDDLVTDEQLFEGGIAISVMRTCEKILTSNGYLVAIKTETLKLLKIVLKMFEYLDTEESPEKQQFVDQALPHVLQLLINMATKLSQEPELLNSLNVTDLRLELYDTLAQLYYCSSKLFRGIESNTVDLTLYDLTQVKSIYLSLISEGDRATSAIFVDLDEFQQNQKEMREPIDVVIKLITVQLRFLVSLSESSSLAQSSQLDQTLNLFIHLNYLSTELKFKYQSDFNEYVSDETGLSLKENIRASLDEVMSDASEIDNSIFIESLVKKLSEAVQNNSPLIQVEAIAQLLSSSFSNEADMEDPSFNLTEFLEYILTLISEKFISVSDDSQFLVARLIMMIPKYIMKFELILKPFGLTSLKRILSNYSQVSSTSDGLQILESSILISFQYFNHFLRAAEFDQDIQYRLISFISRLKEDADEDADLMMLEALTILICIDNKSLSMDENTLMLILSIGFKDCSNLSLVPSTIECVEDLINKLPLENYLTLCSKGLPHLTDILMNSDGAYSSEVDLALQVLSIFIRGPNKDDSSWITPNDVFQYVFPTIYKFILNCEDDALLNSSSDVFNEFLSNSSELIPSYNDTETGYSGNEILLKIVSKFLSPGLSDQATAKLGDLIILLIKNFNHESLIQQYLEEILKAVTNRLVTSKEMKTTENLTLIFNTLAISQPQSTIDFLSNFQIDNESALSRLIPVWLSSFETMRGYNKIESNAKAFIEIFKLNDSRLKSIVVDGELLPNQVGDDTIITRSMAKRMPMKYEKLSADVKIVKLLVNELKYQVTSSKNSLHHSHGHNHQGDDEHDHDADDEGGDGDVTADGDDGWEDLEDVGVPTFEQLKNYVDEDDKRETGTGDIQELLIQFFKECTIRNIGGFQDIYNSWLKDEDRKTLTEYVVFT